MYRLFAILQKYDFSSKSQQEMDYALMNLVVCDTAKVRFFKQITTQVKPRVRWASCLRYCKSTIFQANHNMSIQKVKISEVVCDTAKVRFFKQITTSANLELKQLKLFAILQKYDFSSKSQLGMLLILIEVVLTFNGSINWVEFIFFVW